MKPPMPNARVEIIPHINTNTLSALYPITFTNTMPANISFDKSRQ